LCGHPDAVFSPSNARQFLALGISASVEIGAGGKGAGLVACRKCAFGTQLGELLPGIASSGCTDLRKDCGCGWLLLTS
jgi:hypothetical protein